MIIYFYTNYYLDDFNWNNKNISKLEQENINNNENDISTARYITDLLNICKKRDIDINDIYIEDNYI